MTNSKHKVKQFTHSSVLPPQEAPVVIAEKRKLLFCKCTHAMFMKCNTPCSQDGQTPLHMAASGRLDGDLEGRLACIALLLSYKANMELPDKVLLLNPFIHPSIHAWMHSFVHAFIRPSIHPSIYPSIHVFVQSFIHFTHSLTHAFIHSFIHLVTFLSLGSGMYGSG